MNHRFIQDFKSTLFQDIGPQEFNAKALELFHFQSSANPIYAQFVKELNRPEPMHWKEIPCLPIGAFKCHEVRSSTGKVDMVFESSGTTGIETSRHFLSDVRHYEQSFISGFERFYGAIDQYCILALLPAYMERKASSLVYMAQRLIEESKHEESGTYLYEHEALFLLLDRLKKQGQKTLLIGVTFGLLDFVECYEIDFPELIVMETGGMKGRRKELIREEVHRIIKGGFGVEHVHSEYGMTEMLSQAYSHGDGIFHPPSWLNVSVRNITDPFDFLNPGKSGCLNVIDLANVDTCAFIATDDIGRLKASGGFEVLGRADASDIRGCSLLV